MMTVEGKAMVRELMEASSGVRERVATEPSGNEVSAMRPGEPVDVPARETTHAGAPEATQVAGCETAPAAAGETAAGETAPADVPSREAPAPESHGERVTAMQRKHEDG
jgi:hypothetical protein